MSQEVQTAQGEQGGENVSWPVLSRIERRILGVLVEKGKTTPDNYPMTLNALVTGSNQKSNREPVMDVSDAEIEEAMPRLKQMGYVQQILGSGRTDKFRHVLYEAWKVDKVQLAVLGELLLRGPQTEGDLRARSARMEPIADLEALRPVLRTLSNRGLVIYLTAEGRRGTMVTHGFHSLDELEHARARAERVAGEESATPEPAVRGSSPSSTLELRVVELERSVAVVQRQLAELQKQLGG